MIRRLPRSGALCFAMAAAAWLATTGVAKAAPGGEQIRKLIRKDAHTAAVKRCTKLGADAPDANPDLREACAQAHWRTLDQQADPNIWAEFAKRWVGTSWARTAQEREAEEALAAAGETPAAAILRELASRYGNTRAGARIAQRALAAGFAIAVEADTVEAYKAFRDQYPDSAHDSDSRQREAAAALRDAEEADDPATWKALARAYPIHASVARERELAGARKALAESAKIKLDCGSSEAEAPVDEETPRDKDAPPICSLIEAGGKVTVTWSELPGYTITGELVAWRKTGQIAALSAIQVQVGAAPYASDFAQVVAARRGEATEGKWVIELPAELRRPPTAGIDGYAVLLHIHGNRASVLPFEIGNTYERVGHRSRRR